MCDTQVQILFYKVRYRELRNNCYHSNKASFQAKSDVTKRILAIIYDVRKERLMWQPHPFISLSVVQRLCFTDQVICRFFFFCEILYQSTLTQTFRAKRVNLGGVSAIVALLSAFFVRLRYSAVQDCPQKPY
jgi:hypothetical protein